MNQLERRVFLIRALLDENPEYDGIEVPAGEAAQRRVLRALMNVRMPQLIDPDVLEVQDEYLQQRIAEEGVTYLAALAPVRPHLYLWQGDIVRLGVDAIVNDANSGFTGCWMPGHDCIDNRIHTFAGMLLREECASIVIEQGCEEPVGRARMTGAYNLPCNSVIHTVAPQVGREGVIFDLRRDLVGCYRSCYELARQKGVASLAFPCIGVATSRFPRELAAMLAVQTVEALQAADDQPVDVVFCCDDASDYVVYKELLKEAAGRVF